MRRLTLIPSSFDRYATNGVKRSVTPEAFSAGTTAKVISGYLAFQSCADAAEAVNASTAAPAIIVRRLIMTPSFLVLKSIACGVRRAHWLWNAILRPRRPCREPEFLNRRDPAPSRYPPLRPPRDRQTRPQYVQSGGQVRHRTRSGPTPSRSDDRNSCAPDRANAGCRSR